eukprot:TRINITY_DN3876_c0_g1_i1.p2 TRINITY_DN3876_c0_g1~~TRINITY_DN3876_c0_g1_i1.p2  ORF type:complete len:141 (+),score=25.28 TRINITY_DN3876_c0_g1_i1:68-490(+)
MPSLVGSEMCIRDRSNSNNNKSATILSQKQVAHTENSAEKQRNKWPVSKSQQIQTNPEQSEEDRESEEENQILTFNQTKLFIDCLLYTSDAADDMQCVDLGGCRIIKKKKPKQQLSNKIKTDPTDRQKTESQPHDQQQLH